MAILGTSAIGSIAAVVVRSADVSNGSIRPIRSVTASVRNAPSAARPQGEVERQVRTLWRRLQATLRVTQFGHRSRRSRTVGQRLQSDSDRTVGTSRHPVHRGDFAAIEAPRLPDGSCGPGAAMG